MPVPIRPRRGLGRDWVALTLAIAVATALNLITIAVLLGAWTRGRQSGDYALSENGTQVLIAAFGGIIGVLGGYIGGAAVERARRNERDDIADQLEAMPPDSSTSAPSPPTGDDDAPWP